MVILSLLIFAAFYFFQINRMAYAFVTSRELSEEKQTKVFRMVNICITLLFIALYVELTYVS